MSQFPSLEVDCEICKGTGLVTKNSLYGRPYKIDCSNCKQGKVATDEGQKILDFINRHLVSDEIRNLQDQIRSLDREINKEPMSYH